MHEPNSAKGDVENKSTGANHQFSCEDKIDSDFTVEHQRTP